MMEWISVFEQLPQDRILKLLFVIAPHPSIGNNECTWRGIISGYFTRSQGWKIPYDSKDTTCNIQVLYWMDIPDFPDNFKD